MSNKDYEKSNASLWISEKEKEWNSIPKQNNESKVHDFLTGILEYASKLKDPAQAELCVSFFKACQESLPQCITCYINEDELLNLGFDSYNGNHLLIAEILFELLSDNGNTNGKNNLAYMIRRKEVSEKSEYKPIDALKLLRFGVEANDPFSFVNTALTLALCFGTEADWRLADEIMEKLPAVRLEGVVRWWLDVARSGEIEGVLVHYLLLRHNKITQSDLGTLKSMSFELCADINEFPEWLKTPM